MAYTWGYIKDAALAALDRDEKEAQQMGWLSRFPFYANAVITQVSATVKPKLGFFEVEVFTEGRKAWLYDKFIKDERQKWEDSFLNPGLIDEEVWAEKLEELNKYFEKTHPLVNTLIKMPEDHISFGDDICWFKSIDWQPITRQLIEQDFVEAHDEDFKYAGMNQIICLKPGKYIISYNARWFLFTKDLDNNIVLDVPADILECLPSYLASQCYKIDDEVKAAIYRNEYEIMFARIEPANYRNTRTFKVGGGW